MHSLCTKNKLEQFCYNIDVWQTERRTIVGPLHMSRYANVLCIRRAVKKGKRCLRFSSDFRRVIVSYCVLICSAINDKDKHKTFKVNESYKIDSKIPLFSSHHANAQVVNAIITYTVNTNQIVTHIIFWEYSVKTKDLFPFSHNSFRKKSRTANPDSRGCGRLISLSDNNMTCCHKIKPTISITSNRRRILRGIFVCYTTVSSGISEC